MTSSKVPCDMLSGTGWTSLAHAGPSREQKPSSSYEQSVRTATSTTTGASTWTTNATAYTSRATTGAQSRSLRSHSWTAAPQRLHSGGVGVAQLAGVEQAGARDAEQVAHRHRHPFFGQNGVDLGLETGPQMDQLGPVADQLSQLAQLGRGDPRLGQASHAQQIDQVGGIAPVFSELPRSVPRLRCAGAFEHGAAQLG